MNATTSTTPLFIVAEGMHPSGGSTVAKQRPSRSRTNDRITNRNDAVVPLQGERQS